MRRRPKMSPSRPPVTSSTAKLSVYALTVHSRLERLAPRSFWIDGSATFTTVLSSMIMNRAKHMAASVHHLRLPSFSRRRSGIRVLSGGEGRGVGASGHVLAGHDRLERRGEIRALLGGERLDELLDPREAQLEEVVDEVAAGIRDLDRLHAPVLGVLGAGHEAALDQALDRAADRGERQPQAVAQDLQGQLRRIEGEDVQHLQLRHRELGLADRLPVVLTVVGHQVLHEGVHVLEHALLRGLRRRNRCLHACKHCRNGWFSSTSVGWPLSAVRWIRPGACLRSTVQLWKPQLHFETLRFASSAIAWPLTGSWSPTRRPYVSCARATIRSAWWRTPSRSALVCSTASRRGPTRSSCAASSTRPRVRSRRSSPIAPARWGRASSASSPRSSRPRAGRSRR